MHNASALNSRSNQTTNPIMAKTKTDQNPVPLTPAVQKLLDREAELVALHDKYTGDSFWNEQQARIEAGRNHNATPEQIQQAAEAYDGTLERHFAGRIEAIYNVIRAHRNKGFRVFVEEYLTPLHAVIADRRRQLFDAVKALNTEFQGADVTLNRAWQEPHLARLEDLIDQEQPDIGFEHTGFLSTIQNFPVK
jgi:hypothetical protein